MSLASLPADVLAQLLSSKDVSFLVLGLLKCGNTALNHKLAIGVTFLRLELQKGLAITRFPHLIFQLQSLRYLAIKSEGAFFRDPKYWHIALSRLSTKLETLKIASTDAEVAFRNYDPNTSSNASSYVVTSYSRGVSIGIDISKIFPRLHTLSLKPKNGLKCQDYQFFACLPPSLTRLSTTPLQFSVGHRQLLTYLPRSLRVLRAEVRLFDFDSMVRQLTPEQNSCPLEDALQAPPALESISSIRCTEKSHIWLPKTLKNGSVHLTVAVSQTLANLPPGLSSLQINDVEGLDQAGWTAELPPNLTSLDLAALPGDKCSLGPNIATLPSTLAYLTVGFVNFIDWGAIKAHPPQSRWPPHLTHISCYLDPTEPIEWIPHLPQYLRSLELSISARHTFRAIPQINLSDFPSLTSLAVAPITDHCAKVQILGDGPFLRRLFTVGRIDRLPTMDQSTFERLPTCLTELCATISRIPGATWTFPPRLTCLHLEQMPCSWINAIPRSVTRLFLKDVVNLKMPILLAGMPTKLEHFALDATVWEQRLDDVDFSSLKHLRTLSISRFAKLPSSVLMTLPKCLKELTISLDVLCGSDFCFIPPRLTKFELQHRALNSELSHKLGENWPIGAPLNPRDPPIVRREVERRLRALDLPSVSSETKAPASISK